MHTSIAVAVAGLLLVPATATAASPAAQSRAAWERVAPATYALDQGALADVLDAAPAEGDAVRRLTIAIPAPDGGFERFDVVESPVMAPELAAAHPEIATYAAQGVDDLTATARLDLTPLGFHASVRSATGDWYVDPRGGDEHVAYRRGAVAREPFREEALARNRAPSAPRLAGPAGNDPVTLRTYRLALLSTPAYGAAFGGATTAAKVTLVNRLDEVYEQEFAIRLQLVAGNDQLNFDTVAAATAAGGRCGAAACFTADQLQHCDGDTIERTSAVAARVLGGASYDLAHLVMSDADGGGLASLGVVGSSGKGRACTATDDPVGDGFAIDFVAHEVGHQFGAEHTFDSLACADNRSDQAAVRVEPGSGSSIMAYANLCGDDDLQEHSDPYFSQASLAQVDAFVARPEDAEVETQQVALNGFGTGNRFRLRYGNANSTLITEGDNYTAGGIAAAIEAIAGWPAGAAAYVGDVSRGGFTVYIDGIAAPSLLSIVNPVGFPGGFAGRVAVRGSTRYGGTATIPGNRAPSVTPRGAAAYTIPTRTPFELDAAGSDLDGDTLTYSWEQNDGDLAAAGIALFNGTRLQGPLFRIFGGAPAGGTANVASTASARSFPDIGQVLADNTNAATGACPPARDVDCFSELLPTAVWGAATGLRTLHFRVTARDNHAGAGGTDFADVALTVADDTGPFRLTSQAVGGSVGVGAALPVTWDAAGTEAYAPNVKISLSLDGGRTFTKVLAAATPNDGAEVVTVPRVTTANARVRIEGVDNVFYDAARGALAIDAGSPILVNGPPAADFGTVALGAAGDPVTILFSSDGPAPASTGALTLGGADASAFSIVSDGCSGRTLPAYSQCPVTVRFTPNHQLAHSATLTLASNDPGPVAAVALTGFAPAPAPTNPEPSPTPTPPAAFDPARLAAGLLATAKPFTFGAAGGLRLYTKTASTKLGKPKATMTLAAAVCSSGPCAGKATAKLTLTPRKGRKRSSTFTLVKSLKLPTGGATTLKLRLAKADRRRIAAARKATLTLTVTNGKQRVSRTFSLRT